MTASKTAPVAPVKKNKGQISPKSIPSIAEQQKAKVAARAAELAGNAPKADPKKAEAPKAGTAKGATVRKGTGKPVETPKKVTKPAKAVVEFVARTVKPGTPIFACANDQVRPGNGPRLFAHTHAALTVLGLLDASLPAIPKGTLLTLMGQRAVTYHTQEMNFASAPNNHIHLTADGRNKFMTRLVDGKVDGALANAFLALMIDGKVEGTGVAVENIYSFKPVTPVAKAA